MEACTRPVSRSIPASKLSVPCLVFVVAGEGLVRAGSWRQVGRSVADCLNAGLLVIRDDCDVRCRRLAGLEYLDLAIDAEDFGHLGIERFVAALEVIANFMWLEFVGRKDLAHRSLRQASQAGVPGSGSVLAHMPRQQPRGP